jgi:hypothetical protein
VALDRNSKAVEFIEPNVLDRPGFSIAKDDGFADKFGLSLIERVEDR